MRLLRLLSCLLLGAASPAVAASTPEMAGLEQQLASIAARGSVGIAALDLSNGDVVSIHGDEPFPMASTVKVAIAATYLSQVDFGRRTLNDIIETSRGSMSAARLMEMMLTHSDNWATDVLLKDLGGPNNVQTWLHQNGVKGLRVDRTIAQLLAARRDLFDFRDSSTPLAMVELLRKIDKNQLLKPQSRSYLLSVMSRCETGRNRIKGLLPQGTRVEHKTGTLTGLADDVGFMTLPDGRRIALAVFTRGGSNRPATIAQAARAIYDGFTVALRRFSPGYYLAPSPLQPVSR